MNAHRPARPRGAHQGLDFAEVHAGARTVIALHFVPAGDGDGVPAELAAHHVRLALIGHDGERTPIAVHELRRARAGVVEVIADLDLTGGRHADAAVAVELVGVPAIDPLLARFDVALAPRDARPPLPPAPETEAEGAPMSYLAKDYASFVRLLEDRARIVAPAWIETSPADVGVMLRELLAYAADGLSYYQDAVASEAYLGTARQRTSLRRHARLLDYRVDDGGAARVALHVEIDDDVAVVPRGAAFCTRSHHREQEWEHEVPRASRVVFEALTDVTLRRPHNQLRFHDWGLERGVIARGATGAVLAGALPDLRAGDLVILEALRDPHDDRAADPGHRHAVRLAAEPVLDRDLVLDRAITHIRWSREDALPFDLVIDHREPERPRSIALANVVLCDHGATVAPTPITVDADGVQAIAIDATGRPVAVAAHYDDARERGRSLVATLRATAEPGLPCVTVRERRPDRTIAWRQVPDLIDSSRFARDFAVELHEDDRFTVRFGDGASGRALTVGAVLEIGWRTGGGPHGNVANDTVVRVVGAPRPGWRVRNPLPASGGRSGETVAQIRRDVPEAYRRLERGVTAADFAELAVRVDGIADAAARFEWAGSWANVVVHALPDDAERLDGELRAALARELGRRAIAGVTVELRDPAYVAIAVELRVGLEPGRAPAVMRDAILDALAAAPGGKSFVRPRSYGFGEHVYLAPIIARVAAVDGVAWVEAIRFQRAGEPDSALAGGQIAIDATEIARLDGSPDRSRTGFVWLDLVAAS